MNTPLKRLFGATIIAATLSAATAAWAAEPADMINVRGQQVNMVQMGDGPYTVIFESGFGSDLTVWRKVAPAVARSARVVAYSRAGHGKSQARPGERTLSANTSDLEHMIAAAKLRPPFILVGHSYGGFLIRDFAARNPAQVAGMVFVDASDERIEAELRKIDPAKTAHDIKISESYTPAKFKAELKHVQAIFDRGALPAAGPLPDVPVAVLTSSKKHENAEFFLHSPEGMKTWRSLHESFFRQFSTGIHTVTAHAGHNIHLEQPQLVISAIEQVMSLATDQETRRLHAQARAALFSQLDRAPALIQSGRHAEAGLLVAGAIRDSKFGEADINRIGYELLGKRGQPQVAELILKANAQAHAQSDNAQDSYGEVLLGAKKPAEAKAQFLNAISIAEKQGKGERVLAGYRGNLARAEQALAQSARPSAE
ncbi:alpha/beta fold hydrolase [Massilia sp. GCM10020059]|uniref:Alpha/beta hydrolase n=1 Tax=Massilia agrisoli TaxID=2892444 RepID=A0ABS8IPC6_9BURK|nr:alpha/beta hydrolase [Massilia agrisoli]MCC6069796.1 alpha/beta hydrolase [Massilia agrisoli]